MSLNGLDDAKVKEAHDAAVAEPGGWYELPPQSSSSQSRLPLPSFIPSVSTCSIVPVLTQASPQPGSSSNTPVATRLSCSTVGMEALSIFGIPSPSTKKHRPSSDSSDTGAGMLSSSIYPRTVPDWSKVGFNLLARIVFPLYSRLYCVGSFHHQKQAYKADLTCSCSPRHGPFQLGL